MKMAVTDKIEVRLVGVVGSDSLMENSQMIFKIHAPIFLLREFSKHLYEVVYVEMSIRDSELEPLFYMPPLDNGFSKGDMKLYTGISQTMAGSYEISWTAYKTILSEGVSEEVASMCLPVSIYSTAYVTMSIRSISAFLLSTNSTYEDKELSGQIEKHFEREFPITYGIYVMQTKEN